MSSNENILKHMNKDGGERSFEEVVSRLVFIGKIKHDEVVDVKSLSLMKIGWGTTLYRTAANIIWQCNETKERTYEFFRDTINNAYDLGAYYAQDTKNEIHQKLLDMIIVGMEQSLIGISNTKRTYKKYTMFCGKLITLMKTVRIKMDELKKFLIISKTEDRVITMEDGVPTLVASTVVSTTNISSESDNDSDEENDRTE